MRHRGRTARAVTALVVAAVTAFGAVACGSGTRDAQGSPTALTPLPAAPAEGERGRLVASAPMAGVVAGATVTRVVYRSTAGYVPEGSESPTPGTFGTEVSGVVAVPSGAPPPGGWPIVAFGHGTTGTLPDCGPSNVPPDLLTSRRWIAPLVARGFVVAATDYQGLGVVGADFHPTPLPHPYLEPRTAAFNMIDAVRAARAVEPRASTRWAAYGISQGGHAAWAAAEAAADYGAGLRLVGAATVVPAADLTGITADGVDTRLSLLQKLAVPNLLFGIGAVHPGFDPTGYARGRYAEDADVFRSCGSGSAKRKAGAVIRVGPDEASYRDEAAVTALREVLTEFALPKRRLEVPLLVRYGTEDSLIEPEWTAAAIRRACDQGTRVEADPVAAEHGSTGDVADEARWLAALFAGEVVPGTCR